MNNATTNDAAETTTKIDRSRAGMAVTNTKTGSVGVLVEEYARTTDGRRMLWVRPAANAGRPTAWRADACVLSA